MFGNIKKILKLAFPDLIVWYHRMRIAKIYHNYTRKRHQLGFEFVGPESIQSESFESHERSLVVASLKTADLFVDVGANIGYYTCIARALNKQVVAVEPLPENLEYLYKNISLNGWNDIEIWPVGLAAGAGIMTLYGSSTSASLLKNWAGTSELLKRTVPVTTMDRLLLSRISGGKCVIKVDVEGAEYDLLKGSSGILSVTPSPEWIIEICFDENQQGVVNPKFADTFKLFWEKGYEAFTADSEFRKVLPEDVTRWVQNKKKDFEGINYWFRKYS